MGYRDKTRRLDLEDLAEGCYVEARNPKLLTQSQIDDMLEAATVDGKVDNDRLLEAFVISWKLFDPETDDELALTDDGSAIRRAPAAVGRWINTAVVEAFDPR